MLERFYRGRAGRHGPEGTGPRAADRHRAGKPLGRIVSLGNRQGGGAEAELRLPELETPATREGKR